MADLKLHLMPVNFGKSMQVKKINFSVSDFLQEKTVHFDVLLSMIKESGFEMLDWFYTGASFTAPQASWKAKLARIPRRLANAVDRDLGVRLLGGDTLMVLVKAT